MQVFSWAEVRMPEKRGRPLSDGPGTRKFPLRIGNDTRNMIDAAKYPNETVTGFIRDSARMLALKRLGKLDASERELGGLLDGD